MTAGAGIGGRCFPRGLRVGPALQEVLAELVVPTLVADWGNFISNIALGWRMTIRVERKEVSRVCNGKRAKQ